MTLQASQIPALLSAMFDPDGTGMTEEQHHCVAIVEENVAKLASTTPLTSEGPR